MIEEANALKDRAHQVDVIFNQTGVCRSRWIDLARRDRHVKRGRNINVLAVVSTAGVFGQMLCGELTDVAHLSRTCRLSTQAVGQLVPV